MKSDAAYGASYRRAVRRQLALRGHAGFEAAVGGYLQFIGGLERDAVDAAGLPADGFLIDIGCGAGRLAAALRDRPALRYLGLDVSPELLAEAKRRTERPDWRFEIVREAVIPAMDSCANMAALFSVITHLPPDETRRYLRECKRTLRPGGAALVSFLDPAIPAHRAHIRPRWIEAILTRIGWASNVATSTDEIRAWTAEAGLDVERIESPSVLGQSMAVLRKPS